MPYLRQGVSGEPVRRLQVKLGVPADGRFGPGTEAALKAYQQKNGLAVDGVAGPDTFMQMGLGELVLLAPGARGEAVKKLQAALGLPADGQFGPATQKAVSAFQAAHGLEVETNSRDPIRSRRCPRSPARSAPRRSRRARRPRRPPLRPRLPRRPRQRLCPRSIRPPPLSPRPPSRSGRQSRAGSERELRSGRRLRRRRPSVLGSPRCFCSADIRRRRRAN